MIPYCNLYNPSSNLANLHSFPVKEKEKTPPRSVQRPKSPLSAPAAAGATNLEFAGANNTRSESDDEEEEQQPERQIVPEATIQFYEEDIAEYRPGGYHPVQLGDTFNEKYEIVRKLGFGKFSTIWLAIDTTVERPVALKILKADSQGIELDVHEQETMNYAKSDDPNHVIGYLERFVHKGPNGDHVCLVFGRLGKGAVSGGERSPDAGRGW
ncbi:hypothetical protein P167DRAFT_526917 [Morchella conica CCBAS932]|uniref:non-specific serine/threonine protein kinase n=1 Tax=Morchella conica CCBAS932 TaxID=1392247 RepID=A0A3N4KK08_9PEZI|nr:hypothetical protein P167DRAFT_526917 [Morchella conica CCBAS932]